MQKIWAKEKSKNVKKSKWKYVWKCFNKIIGVITNQKNKWKNTFWSKSEKIKIYDVDLTKKKKCTKKEVLKRWKWKKNFEFKGKQIIF